VEAVSTRHFKDHGLTSRQRAQMLDYLIPIGYSVLADGLAYERLEDLLSPPTPSANSRAARSTQGEGSSSSC